MFYEIISKAVNNKVPVYASVRKMDEAIKRGARLPALVLEWQSSTINNDSDQWVDTYQIAYFIAKDCYQEARDSLLWLIREIGGVATDATPITSAKLNIEAFGATVTAEFYNEVQSCCFKVIKCR